MKKTLLSLIILMLVFSTLAAAQTELAQTYEAGSYTFQYPDSWVVTRTSDDPDAVSLSNIPYRDDLQYNTLQPGEVMINISALTTAREDLPLPPGASAEFLLGYNAGLFSMLVYLTGTFAGEEQQLTYGEPMMLTLDHHNGLAVPYTVAETYEGWIIILDLELPFFIIASGYGGEIDAWKDTVLAVIDSIQAK